jgi:hypothetical protein
MKARQTHLGTTPSGKKIYLERLPSEYPRFSAEDHSYAAVIHGANRTDGGKRAEQHREAARGKLRSLSRASGRVGKQGKLPNNYEVVETVDGDWMILINGFQTGSDVDRSGAGSDTYPTYADAYKAALALASGGSHATRRGRAHANKKQSSRAAYATKSSSEAMVDRMIGRRVKSGWHGIVDGEIIQWEPFGAGMTDALVKDAASGTLTWYASHGLSPIDGKGPLPSRAGVRKMREAEMKEDLKKIGERWAKEPPPPRIRR